MRCEKKWTAILLAGQRPGVDPFAAQHNEQWKALIPFMGRPMIAHIVETLASHPHIGKIYILAQEKGSFLPFLEKEGKEKGDIEFFESGEGIAQSIAALMQAKEPSYPILITTADHPLLTHEMLDEFMAHKTGDIAVGMVRRTAMLTQFPQARRTWYPMRDDGWSGTNLFALHKGQAIDALYLWAKAEKNRKHFWKLLWNFGPLLALKAAFRQFTMAQLLAAIGRTIHVDAALVELNDPVAAIDVDKESDLRLATQIYTARKQEE